MAPSLAARQRADTLRVGIDATTWTNARGFGRYTRSIVPALVRAAPAFRYTLFADVPEPLDGAPPCADVQRVATSRPTTAAAVAGGRRRVRDLATMSRALSRAPVDVLFFPAVYSYVPVWSRARTIVTIYDAIAESFPDQALGAAPARVFWRVKSALARRQADAILTPSEFVRRDLVRRFGLDPARVFALGAGAAPAFRPLPRPEPTPALRALGLDADADWIVYVGGGSPHKRIDALIDAARALRAASPRVRVALVGDHEGDGFRTVWPELRAHVERAGLAGVVRFTGFLPDEDLAVLLNRAAALALPSMMEGFGLPAIEAAACGCPVVATSASPLPEILGEAMLPVRPGDAGDLARALGRVLGDPALRARMRAAGPAAAAAHTWDDAGVRVADAIRTVARW